MGMSSLCLELSGLPKWQTRSLAGIYIGHSPFYALSVYLVLKTATGHVSHQFHVVFADEFYTVPFMREGTMPPNWTDLVQRSSQSGAPENIDLKDTWFTIDPEENTRKTQVTSRASLQMIIIKCSRRHGPNRMYKKSTASKGEPVSEVIKRPASEVDKKD